MIASTMNCENYYEERLQALVRQESMSYKTIDYMADEHNVEAASSAVPSEIGHPDFASSPCGKKKRRLMSSLPDDSSTSEVPSASCTAASSVLESSTRKYWREMMCAWAYRGKMKDALETGTKSILLTGCCVYLWKVIDHFDLRRELVGITMSYLDRYMSTLNNPWVVDKTQYKLIAMTCMYLAVKLYEFKHIGIPGSCSTMDTIRKLSQGSYTLRQMEAMEMDIMQRLQWRLHPPTPQAFIDLFVHSETSESCDVGNFLVELAAMDYFFVAYKPSEIATAALLNAMDQLYGGLPPLAVSQVTGRLQSFASPRVQECRTRLDIAYRQLGDTDDFQWQRAAGGNISPVTVTTKYF
jgi:hypothetical protein